jgi:hypothetical protein
LNAWPNAENASGQKNSSDATAQPALAVGGWDVGGSVTTGPLRCSGGGSEAGAVIFGLLTRLVGTFERTSTPA